MTKVDLMVLGLLSEEPMHGYQLKRVLEDKHADLWSEVSTGHLYYTLKKLRNKGLVVEKTDQKGNRPPRHVYSLTQEGREALEGGLDELDVHSQRLYFGLDTVIGFSKPLELDADKLAELLDKRLKAVREEEKQMREAWKKMQEDGELTFGEYVIFQHRKCLLKAERKWLRWAAKATAGVDYKNLQATEFEEDGPYNSPR
jgi:DNA-binding PadR family transcriptional regulator